MVHRVHVIQKKIDIVTEVSQKMLPVLEGITKYRGLCNQVVEDLLSKCHSQTSHARACEDHNKACELELQSSRTIEIKVGLSDCADVLRCPCDLGPSHTLTAYER